MEYFIFGFILLVLFLEFIFIFKLINKKIEKLIVKFLFFQKKVLKLVYDIEIISEIKENLVKELKLFNYVMENMLFYCCIVFDGLIIYIGEKFVKFLNYMKFFLNKIFLQVLIIDEKE